MNGQMGPSGRPQMSQAPMARHPSREQLIDYLMLKVSQQPPGPPRIPHDTMQQEVSQLQSEHSSHSFSFMLHFKLESHRADERKLPAVVFHA